MTEVLAGSERAALDPSRNRDASDALMSIRSVAKTYAAASGPVRALEPVDLDVHRGEFISFVGPSGCGKTTLLNMMSGLLAPSEGTLEFQGEPFTKPSRRIGMMFQKAVLLPWRTIRSNTLLPSEISGQDKVEAAARVDAVLETVGLAKFAQNYPHELSGGMQQRAALARVLATDPDLLLMDEPFGALDEFTREAMNLEVSRIVESSDIAFGFVTHNISEAVFLSDRVVVMSPRPGRVVGVIDIDLPRPRRIDVMQQPRFTELTFEVRNLLGDAHGID